MDPDKIAELISDDPDVLQESDDIARLEGDLDYEIRRLAWMKKQLKEFLVSGETTSLLKFPGAEKAKKAIALTQKKIADLKSRLL